jgi:hypothetical protein
MRRKGRLEDSNTIVMGNEVEVMTLRTSRLRALSASVAANQNQVEYQVVPPVGNLRRQIPAISERTSQVRLAGFYSTKCRSSH